ncbi:hypothetical protein GGR56DRAFT_648089 [Xylariaceae sp. FL0804]|nr:hypothetical protein GGR56DRAFT_648089 [Xylariaceae sp. FL0804]
MVQNRLMLVVLVMKPDRGLCAEKERYRRVVGGKEARALLQVAECRERLQICKAQMSVVGEEKVTSGRKRGSRRRVVKGARRSCRPNQGAMPFRTQGKLSRGVLSARQERVSVWAAPKYLTGPPQAAYFANFSRPAASTTAITGPMPFWQPTPNVDAVDLGLER